MNGEKSTEGIGAMDRDIQREVEVRAYVLAKEVCSESLPEEMPGDEELVLFADGTLRGARAAAIQALARKSVPAAILIGGFVQDYSAVRRLCREWCGFRGAILASTGRLPEDLAERWRAHLEHCTRSRILTKALFVPLAPVRQPAAMGWGFAAVFLALFWLKPRMVAQQPFPIPAHAYGSPAGIGEETGSKVGGEPFVTDQLPPSNADSETLRLDSARVQETGIQFENVIQSRLDLALRRARDSKDPEEKKNFLKLANQYRMAWNYAHQAASSLNPE